MTTETGRLLHLAACGTPEEKLARSHRLVTALGGRSTAEPKLTAALETLRGHSLALKEQMASMGLGRLCGDCAARPGGGCCSEQMADNSDSLQIAINLLLGAAVEARRVFGGTCCFLGEQGCRFQVKPIFCLNYNCSHILTASEKAILALLYRHANAVLSSQAMVESLLVERLVANAEQGLIFLPT